MTKVEMYELLRVGPVINIATGRLQMIYTFSIDVFMQQSEVAWEQPFNEMRFVCAASNTLVLSLI